MGPEQIWLLGVIRWDNIGKQVQANFSNTIKLYWYSSIIAPWVRSVGIYNNSELTLEALGVHFDLSLSLSLSLSLKHFHYHILTIIDRSSKCFVAVMQHVLAILTFKRGQWQYGCMNIVPNMTKSIIHFCDITKYEENLSSYSGRMRKNGQRGCQMGWWTGPILIFTGSSIIHISECGIII